MNFKNIIFLGFILLALASCGNNKEKEEEQIKEEQIAFEKTADSLTMVNKKMDSLTTNIQKTTNEIEQ